MIPNQSSFFNSTDIQKKILFFYTAKAGDRPEDYLKFTHSGQTIH